MIAQSKSADDVPIWNNSKTEKNISVYFTNSVLKDLIKHSGI